MGGGEGGVCVLGGARECLKRLVGAWRPDRRLEESLRGLQLTPLAVNKGTLQW